LRASLEGDKLFSLGSIIGCHRWNIGCSKYLAVAVYFLPPGTPTSVCAPISTVISLHCVSLDSILPHSFLRRGKKLGAEKNPSKHRCVFLRCSLLFLRCSFGSLFAAWSPLSLSVGVNLSPRLSPNTELYKLKPISLPGLGSSYSGHFIFVYLLSANMPGLLRSSQATGQRWRRYPACTPGYTATSRIPSACASALIWIPFVCTRRAAHNPSHARPFHVYQNVRVSTCDRLRIYSSVYAFDAYIHKMF